MENLHLHPRLHPHSTSRTNVGALPHGGVAHIFAQLPRSTRFGGRGRVRGRVGRNVINTPARIRCSNSNKCNINSNNNSNNNSNIKISKEEEEKVEIDLQVEDEDMKDPFKSSRPYKLIGLTSLAFVICNMDKVNLSVAIIPMSHQLGWNASTAGLVQSSFFWGYALSQLPGGWLAKQLTGRKVLEFGVLGWSLATALVPIVAGFMPGLIISRILVGIGEGVSPAAATELIARTIPLTQRSRAVAFVFSGLSVGSVLGLLFAPPCIENFGWESVFYIFGLLGLLWFVGFQLFADEVKSAVPAQTITLDERSCPLERIHKESGCMGNGLCSFLWQLGSLYFLVMAAYLLQVAILPSLGSIVVSSIASSFADTLISEGVETTSVRKLCQTIAFISPAICMTISSLDLGLSPWTTVGVITTGLSLSSFALAGLYCTHQDISPEYASILLGLSSTAGAFPGIIGVALTGYLLDQTHSWTLALFTPSIFFYITGTLVWLAFASSKPQKFSNSE